MNKEQIEKLVKLRNSNKTWSDIAANYIRGYSPNALRKTYYRFIRKNEIKLKVLLLDIETAPMLGFVWGLWDNNIALNQLKKDWHVLSWSAKWLNDPPEKVMYLDQRNCKNIEDDKKLLQQIWKLLDEADVIITQNGKSFDVKKLNARFLQNGFKPPSSFRHIDTARIAKKHFAFTSNKLEYLTDKLCTKYKKLKPSKFSGFTLWRECLNGNIEAWKEMEKYNKYDVLSLEELYHKLQPWDKSIDFNVYNGEDLTYYCNCGNSKFKKHKKLFASNKGVYKRLICTNCGQEHKEKINLLSKEKRKTLKN